MEASPHRKSRVSVLAEGTGYDGCVPDPVKQRKPSLLHVHSLCSKCQVNTLSSSCIVLPVSQLEQIVSPLDPMYQC